jgi:Tfp pilus assembly protein PilZ
MVHLDPLSASRRRHQRLLCSIPVVLKERTSTTRLYTENISRGGAFVVTDGAKAERQLLNLSIELPEGPIEVLAMVAWRSPAEGKAAKRLPGMGINFFALAKNARDQWDRFVLELEAQTRSAAAAPAPPPRARSMTPIRRRHPRHTSRFLVRLQDRAEMRELYTYDISAGGMFLQTQQLEEEGQRVKAVLVHPDTKAEFPLPGNVVRIANGPDPEERGIAVQFDELSGSREAALLSFIETGAEFLDTDDDQAARMALLRKAAAIEQLSPLPLVALAQALIEDFSLEEGIEALNGALARDPACLPAHRELYKAFNMMRLPERAKRHLEEIRRLERHGS